MKEITSRDNKHLKIVRKIRDGQIENAIFIEGKRLASEVLRSNLKLSEIYVSESFAVSELNKVLTGQIGSKTNEIFLLPDKIFNSIADTKNSQGIIVIGEKPETGKSEIESTLDKNISGKSITVLLHEINNPSNLGAILRTAEAVGVAGIITTTKSADIYSAKALRSSMGASLRLAVWENADFDSVINWAKTKNLATICADANLTKKYTDVEWKRNCLLIFGSEAHGLSRNELCLIDEIIYIPMQNDVESLNLAVACGIILFEATKD